MASLRAQRKPDHRSWAWVWIGEALVAGWHWAPAPEVGAWLGLLFSGSLSLGLMAHRLHRIRDPDRTALKNHLTALEPWVPSADQLKELRRSGLPEAVSKHVAIRKAWKTSLLQGDRADLYGGYWQ